MIRCSSAVGDWNALRSSAHSARVPSGARIALLRREMAVRVSMVRFLLFALPNLQGSSTEEWSLIVALCRPRQGLTWQHSAQSILSLVRRFSQTPFSQEGDLVRWAPRSRFLHAHVRCAVMAPSPKAPVLPVLQVHLLNGHTSFVFEHRLSAGTRVTSHHGFLHDFHHQATTSCTTHELSLF